MGIPDEPGDNWGPIYYYDEQALTSFRTLPQLVRWLQRAREAALRTVKPDTPIAGG